MQFKILSKSDCEQARLWRNETLESLRTPFGLTQEQQEEFYINTVCDRNANSRYWGIWVEDETKYNTITCCGPEKTTPISCSDTPAMTIYSKQSNLIGMAGIENIERENGRGEISLIMSPEYRGKGNGVQALEILLDKGFNEMNLYNIWGVCYECNKAGTFWQREINRYNAFYTLLPNMKHWRGKYWKGLYFNFERGQI